MEFSRHHCWDADNFFRTAFLKTRFGGFFLFGVRHLTG
jgi:hypothetical protein